MHHLVANLPALLQHSLFSGFILSALLSLMILASLYINPAMWLDDAPADIKAKVGPMSAQTKRQRSLFAAPFFGTLIVVLLASVVQLRPIAGGELPFIVVFLHVFIVLMIFNVVDLLVIDWLILATIQPRFAIVPGTEGLAGWRDYGFHWRAFLKGTKGIFIGSLLIAGLTSVIVYFMSG